MQVNMIHICCGCVCVLLSVAIWISTWLCACMLCANACLCECTCVCLWIYIETTKEYNKLKDHLKSLEFAQKRVYHASFRREMHKHTPHRCWYRRNCWERCNMQHYVWVVLEYCFTCASWVNTANVLVSHEFLSVPTFLHRLASKKLGMAC